MKRFLIYILPFVFFVFISVNSKAQINFNQKEQFPKVKPNSLYIEQYLKNTSLLKNSKALIIGSNESYNIYQLPLDNMPCAMPNTQITYHINLLNPEYANGYSIDNIPNALSNLDLIK
jgi:hypothetical protein